MLFSLCVFSICICLHTFCIFLSVISVHIMFECSSSKLPCVVFFEALGHVDKNWFHNLSLKARVSERNGLKRTPLCAAQNDSVVYDDDGLTATQRGDDSTRIHDPTIITPVGVALPLFSPAQPQGAVCGVQSGDYWKRVNSGKNLMCQQTSPGAAERARYYYNFANQQNNPISNTYFGHGNFKIIIILTKHSFIKVLKTKWSDVNIVPAVMF